MNRTRFHSLSSEFSLYWSENRVKFTLQRMKFLHSIDGVNYSLDFLESRVVGPCLFASHHFAMGCS